MGQDIYATLHVRFSDKQDVCAHATYILRHKSGTMGSKPLFFPLYRYQPKAECVQNQFQSRSTCMVCSTMFQPGSRQQPKHDGRGRLPSKSLSRGIYACTTVPKHAYPSRHDTWYRDPQIYDDAMNPPIGEFLPTDVRQLWYGRHIHQRLHPLGRTKHYVSPRSREPIDYQARKVALHEPPAQNTNHATSNPRTRPENPNPTSIFTTATPARHLYTPSNPHATLCSHAVSMHRPNLFISGTPIDYARLVA